MNGFARTTVIVALAAALVAAAVVVWMLSSSGARRFGTPAGESDHAAASSGTAAAAGRPATRAIAPTAFSETEPAAATDSRGLPLEIEVVAPDGRPAAKARVVLVQEEKVLGAKNADDGGLATFAAGTGEAVVWVAWTGIPILKAKVRMDAGRRRIDLPAGVRIQGRVEVNGGVPRETVQLWANGSDETSVDGTVYEALRGESATSCATSPSGAFELDGLKAGSEWRFNGRSEGYRVDEVLVDGAPRATVQAPAQGVVVKCTRHPVVRGRVVAGEPRAPVASAHCEVILTGPAMTQMISRGTAEDGRFAFSVGNMFKPEFVVERFEITVRGPNDIAKKIVLDPAPDRDTDLGDVVIPAGRAIRYVVRNAAGVPIADAFARTRGTVDPGTKTDAQGAGTIVVPPDASEFLVGALRYEVTKVAIPEPLPDPLPVVLEPNSGIEVRISAKARLRVQLVSDDAGEERLRDDYEPGNDPIYIAAGASGYESATFDVGASEVTYDASSDNRVVIAGLKPGIATTVNAVDGFGQAHASSTVTLAKGEWKTVELSVTKNARTLRGRVRDAAGQPVAGAEAKVDVESRDSPETSSGRRSMNVVTDASGKFLIPDLYDAVVDFSVRKQGYAPVVRNGLALPDEGVDLDLTLSRGTRITVRVLDGAGVPIPELQVSAEFEHLSTFGTESTPGSYAIADLAPDSQVKVWVTWANRSWTRDVRVKEGHVETITMPKAGEIVVDCSEIGDGPFWFILKIAGEPVTRQLLLDRDDGRSRGAHAVGRIVVGDYEAVLQSCDEPSPAATQSVTVRDGETTRIVFHKPR